MRKENRVIKETPLINMLCNFFIDVTIMNYKISRKKRKAQTLKMVIKLEIVPSLLGNQMFEAKSENLSLRKSYAVKTHLSQNGIGS